MNTPNALLYTKAKFLWNSTKSYIAKVPDYVDLNIKRQK